MKSNITSNIITNSGNNNNSVGLLSTIKQTTNTQNKTSVYIESRAQVSFLE